MERTLKISGMTCGNCVKHVTKALLGVSGVTKAEVDLAKETAHVEHAPSLPVVSLVEAVKDAGYEAKEVASQPKAGWRLWKR